MFILAAATVVLGVALLILGLRGRRIDNHPLCRRCRFDLVGLSDVGTGAPRQQANAAAAPTRTPPRCPECGADISRLRAVRTGHRRRLRSVIVVACVCLLGGLGVGGAAGWAAATKFNWNTIKPVWWLKSESASPHTPTAAAAIAELTVRLGDSRLESGDTSVLISRALDYQADPDRTWIPQWGDFVGAAWKAGLLSDEQRLAFARNAVEPRVAIRPRLRRNEPTAIEIHFRGSRVGRSTPVVLQPTLIGAEIDGQPIEAPKFAGRASLQYSGSSAIGNSITIAAEPGAHVLRTVWSYAALDPFDPAGPVRADWERIVETPITVLPEDAELIRLIKDESLRRAMEAAIRAGPIQLARTGGGGLSFNHEFRLTNLPADVAFDSIWRAGDREWPIGTIAGRGGSGQHATNYGGDAPALDPGTAAVDIILRPSIKAAARNIDVVDIWDGEIVIENVPVEWPDAPAAGGGVP